MRILNFLVSLAIVGLCSLAILAGFAINMGHPGSMSAALAQPALTASQSEALTVYNKTVQDFRSILRERRAADRCEARAARQTGTGPLSCACRDDGCVQGSYRRAAVENRQAPMDVKFLRPISMPTMSRLSTSTRILFRIMQAPPADAQKSDTPFKDVVDLGTAIARVKGLDAAHAEVAGRISLAVFFAETDGNQNIGNARSNAYKGSFQTGVSEDKIGQKKWAAIKKSVAAIDPKLTARDDKEEARVGNSDQRYNHWTAVRNGLMNAHADLFPKIPAIMKALPDPIDQMRFFELIQIIPSPAKAALASGNLLNYRISEPRIMGYLRNNSMFAYGKADRAKTSATMREILDSMWLFNDIFDRALAKFGEIKAQQKG